MLGSFDGADHDVALAEGSLAARAAGELVHATKSHHHQGVDRLGEGLIVSGSSTLDELPEAIELPEPPVRARRAVAPRGGPQSLIAAFVQAAGARSRSDGAARRRSARRRRWADEAPSRRRRGELPVDGARRRGSAPRPGCAARARSYTRAQCGCRGRSGQPPGGWWRRGSPRRCCASA